MRINARAPQHPGCPQPRPFPFLTFSVSPPQRATLRASVVSLAPETLICCSSANRWDFGCFGCCSSVGWTCRLAGSALLTWNGSCRQGIKVEGCWGGTLRVTGTLPPHPHRVEMVLGELMVKPPTSRVRDGTYSPLFNAGETFFGDRDLCGTPSNKLGPVWQGLEHRVGLFTPKRQPRGMIPPAAEREDDEATSETRHRGAQ